MEAIAWETLRVQQEGLLQPPTSQSIGGAEEGGECGAGRVLPPEALEERRVGLGLGLRL